MISSIIDYVDKFYTIHKFIDNRNYLYELYENDQMLFFIGYQKLNDIYEEENKNTEYRFATSNIWNDIKKKIEYDNNYGGLLDANKKYLNFLIFKFEYMVSVYNNEHIDRPLEEINKNKIEEEINRIYLKNIEDTIAFRLLQSQDSGSIFHKYINIEKYNSNSVLSNKFKIRNVSNKDNIQSRSQTKDETNVEKQIHKLSHMGSAVFKSMRHITVSVTSNDTDVVAVDFDQRAGLN
jgi:hypothetical protein